MTENEVNITKLQDQIKDNEARDWVPGATMKDVAAEAEQLSTQSYLVTTGATRQMSRFNDTHSKRMRKNASDLRVIAGDPVPSGRDARQWPRPCAGLAGLCDRRRAADDPDHGHAPRARRHFRRA